MKRLKGKARVWGVVIGIVAIALVIWMFITRRRDLLFIPLLLLVLGIHFTSKMNNEDE